MKTLGKRGMALLLSLILCMSMFSVETLADSEQGSGAEPAADSPSRLVYVHYHNDEPDEGSRDSVLYTALVDRGDSYAPRAGDAQVSERTTEDGIPLVVTGWKDKDGTEYDAENPIRTDDSTPEIFDLYPVMSPGTWLFFDANGGVYVDPQFVPYGESTKEVTTTRDGYTFGGWYDGETRFEFGNT